MISLTSMIFGLNLVIMWQLKALDYSIFILLKADFQGENTRSPA